MFLKYMKKSWLSKFKDEKVIMILSLSWLLSLFHSVDTVAWVTGRAASGLCKT